MKKILGLVAIAATACVLPQIASAQTHSQYPNSPAQEGQITSKSAKMTDNQANSGTAEGPEQRQMVAKSAKMGGTGPSLTVGKETIPGRPNGMVAMLKQDEKQDAQLNQQDAKPRPTPQSAGAQNQEATAQDQQAAIAQDQQGTDQIVSASSLSRNEIRQIQTALNNDGFNAGPVDGKWGPHTRQALQKFIRSKNGQLTEDALAQLGVNPSQQGHSTQRPQNNDSGSQSDNGQ
jgi:Putative peptidoglycan binding domain